jgi:hypothetical protein
MSQEQIRCELPVWIATTFGSGRPFNDGLTGDDIMKTCLGWMIGAVCVIGTVTAAEPPAPAPAPVTPERLQKLIAQLGDPKFKVREEATQELSRLGRAALRALKETAANTQELELRKRAERLIDEIRSRDRARDRLLAVVSRLQKGKPAPSDRQVAQAIYLLSVSRPATEAELAAVEKRLKGAKDRVDEAEEVMWPLMTGREFNDKLADLNLRLLAIKQKLSGRNLAEMLHQLNSAEFQKTLTDLSAPLLAALGKRSDERVADSVFLLFLGRFPDPAQATTVIAHLKKFDKREKGLEDILWALTNTKEFYMGNR